MCEPSIERNGTGEGAALSLDAIGKQDTFFLTKDPNNSFFHYKNMQHTKFIKKYNYHTLQNPQFSTPHLSLKERFDAVGGTSNVISNTVESLTDAQLDSMTWPFNQRVEFVINPKTSGDLIGNMFLKFTIDGEKNPGPWYEWSRMGNQFFTPDAGRAFIDNIQLLINGDLIEKIEGRWLHMNDDIYINNEKLLMKQTMFNGGYPMDMYNRVWIDKTTGMDFYIPLELFFCRSKESNIDNAKRFLPIAALYNQTITIQVNFNKSQYFCANRYFPYIPEITIVSEDYIVTPEERTYIQNSKFDIPLNIIQPQPKLSTGGKVDAIKSQTDLVADYAVKSLHWSFTRTDFFDIVPNDWFGWINRPNTMITYAPYNDMTSYQEHYTINENNNPSMYTVSFFLNGIEYKNFLATDINSSLYPSYYYKFIQNLQHGLSTPYRNVYSMSFTENMKSQNPSGVINFGKITQGNAVMKIVMRDKETIAKNEYTMSLYYNGFKNLKIANGVTQVY